MLTLHSFSVSIADTPILHSLEYRFQSGAITAILGHNGSGKSSLAFALMGHPRYQLTGQLFLGEEDVSNTSPNERNKKGMFLSFQNIPELP